MENNLVGYDIPGWFKPDECNKLYELALAVESPILEIGHFLGRSTSFICQGIRDSKEQKVFRSYDLGFTNYEEVKNFYHDMYGHNMSVPSMYDVAFLNNTTTTEMAKLHLSALNLDTYVELISGNFIDLDHHRYKFIFSDAMHDLIEIEKNLPHVISHSDDECLWAFHDMRNEYIEYIIKTTDCVFIQQIKDLGIFRYKRK